MGWTYQRGAAATNATTEAELDPLQLRFDGSVKLAFQSSLISADGGLLLHLELDGAVGLTDMAAGLLADPRIGRIGRHDLAGLPGVVFADTLDRISGLRDPLAEPACA